MWASMWRLKASNSTQYASQNLKNVHLLHNQGNLGQPFLHIILKEKMPLM